MGIVALQPVPTMIAIATRLLGSALTQYAEEMMVATVSLVMAAIFGLGRAKIFRRLLDGWSSSDRRVCF
jgi:hypothetical protein